MDLRADTPATEGVRAARDWATMSAMSRTATAAAVGRIEHAAARAASADEVFEAVAEEVRRAVPFDSSMWFGMDPGTLLATAPARFEHLDAGYCDSFWHHEFHEQDVGLYCDLARDPVPATALRLATGDRPGRSPRYREFLTPQGFDDELRVVFRTGTNVWAAAGLYRDKGHQAFTEADVAVLAAASCAVGAVLQRHTVASVPWPAGSDAPGLLCFDRDNLLVSANAEAAGFLAAAFGPGPGEDWLAMLSADPAHDLHFPVPIIPLLGHARAVATGHERGPARLRLRGRNGRWLVLHASCLLAGQGGPGNVAVVVSPAKSAEIAPIIIEAYGLTARERDVVRGLARGLATVEIAEDLHLSTHTVRDYLKTVFEKTGVSSRGELVAKLFAEHYSDAMHAVAVHVD